MNLFPHIFLAAALVSSVSAADSITLPTTEQLAEILETEPERIHRTPKEGSIDRGSAKIVEYLVGPMSYTLSLSIGKTPPHVLALSEPYAEDSRTFKELLFKGFPEGMEVEDGVQIEHVAQNRPIVIFLDRESLESPTTKETMTWWLSADKRWMASLGCRRGGHPNDKYHRVFKPGSGELLLAKKLDRILFGAPASKTDEAEQGSAGQPATRPESKPEGDDKPQPESEGRSR
jgi:hypothetical protein